jgi:hypothetical protein
MADRRALDPRTSGTRVTIAVPVQEAQPIGQ